MLKRLFVLIVLIAAVTAAQGAATTQTFSDTASAQKSDSSALNWQQLNQRPSLTGHYVKLLMITFVLLAIFYFALKWMRRLQPEGRKNTRIKAVVLSRTYLTNKHSLWVVVVDRKKYLLGITDANINLIDQLGEVEPDELTGAQEINLPQFSNFLDTLKNKLRS